MFETLHQIDWSKIEQAEGFASHVPIAVQRLASEDESICESAYWELDNHIVLQGDLYQAAFFVIPFLVEILKSNSVICRSYVYDLLFEIANGYEAKEVLCIYGGEKYSLTDACKLAVAENYKVFLFDVSNHAARCRTNALDLLISLEGKSEILVAELLRIKSEEVDNDFAAMLGEAIVEIGNHE